MTIPFCRAMLGEDEKKAICDVIDGGWVVQGPITKEFEAKFAEYVGAKYAVFVDSGTSALDISVKWLLHTKQWKKGQKIGVPSLTFTSTAEALAHNGLRPDFKDVNENFCIESGVDTLPVHLTGNLAGGAALIYDSAHRIMRGDVKDTPALWCYSFYATKNMTTINGGMIATNDEASAAWLRKARDHGISKGTTERYKDGQWAYSIDFVGWREKSDDVHAAIGLAQLAKLDSFNDARGRIITRYNELLGLKRTGLHLYPILVDNRDEFIAYMRDKGVQVSVHFLPLHRMPAYRRWGRKALLPHTEYLGARLVSLPLYPQLTDEEVDYIVQCVKESKHFIQA